MREDSNEVAACPGYWTQRPSISVEVEITVSDESSSTDVYPKAKIDGFELGMFVSYGDCGDAWVEAPDGRIAGLIWETGSQRRFTTAIEPDERRWGTFAVALPLPLTTDSEAEEYLRALLPELRARWEATVARASLAIAQLEWWPDYGNELFWLRNGRGGERIPIENLRLTPTLQEALRRWIARYDDENLSAGAESEWIVEGIRLLAASRAELAGRYAIVVTEPYWGEQPSE